MADPGGPEGSTGWYKRWPGVGGEVWVRFGSDGRVVSKTFLRQEDGRP
jgi:hypothetical protein